MTTYNLLDCLIFYQEIYKSKFGLVSKDSLAPNTMGTAGQEEEPRKIVKPHPLPIMWH